MIVQSDKVRVKRYIEADSVKENNFRNNSIDTNVKKT
jgi:hypothetical protein